MASSCQLPRQRLSVNSEKVDAFGDHSEAHVLFTTSVDATVQEAQTATRSRARHDREMGTRTLVTAEDLQNRIWAKQRALYRSRMDTKSAKNGTAQQPTTSPDKRHTSAYPSPERMISQPETRPISQEQLVAEVKGIYAGLVMVESKCIEVDNAQSSNNENTAKLNNEQWQALIALHRTLLHEHHDFFLASQHPSASPALRRLAAKYAMPARLWRHGIHSFLELLRQRLPASLEHMLTFIHLANSTMTLLYETVPASQDTWIECLGDLSRYRMAIEDDDIRERDIWTSVSRHWYSKAADKAPTNGRLYHHLAIPALPHALQGPGIYKNLRVSWLTSDEQDPYWQVESASRQSLQSRRRHRTRGFVPGFPLDQTDYTSRGPSLATSVRRSSKLLDHITASAKSSALFRLLYYLGLMHLALIPFAAANSALSRSPFLLGVPATISFTAEMTSLQLKSTGFDHGTPPTKVLLRLLSSLSLVSFIGLALLRHLRSAQEIQRFVGVGLATAGFLRLASRESLTAADMSGDTTAWIDEVNLFALIAAVSGVLFVRSKLFTRAFVRRRARDRVADDDDNTSDNDGWFHEDEETGRGARVDAQNHRDDARARDDRNDNGDIGLALLGNFAQSMAGS